MNGTEHTLAMQCAVNHLNNLFTSSDPKNVIEFYSSFDSREQLIQWMLERPKSLGHIHEVEGDKEIIVVIPTADSNGKYAKHCREDIFEGLHIIFVESGGRDDLYFNFAHNVNLGMKKALEYNPKWIVLSNDDMYKIDDVAILRRQLKCLENERVDAVFTDSSVYHSVPMMIVRRNLLFSLYNIYRRGRLGMKMNSLEKKFQVKYAVVKKTNKNKLLFRRRIVFVNLIDFGIFGAAFIKRMKGSLYDEIFINEAEDSDLSVSISLKPYRVKSIKFKIGDMIGSTLGTGADRNLRSIAGMCYFNFKWSSVFDRILY